MFYFPEVPKKVLGRGIGEMRGGGGGVKVGR